MSVIVPIRINVCMPLLQRNITEFEYKYKYIYRLLTDIVKGETGKTPFLSNDAYKKNQLISSL